MRVAVWSIRALGADNLQASIEAPGRSSQGGGGVRLGRACAYGSISCSLSGNRGSGPPGAMAAGCRSPVPESRPRPCIRPNDGDASELGSAYRRSPVRLTSPLSTFIRGADATWCLDRLEEYGVPPCIRPPSFGSNSHVSLRMAGKATRTSMGNCRCARIRSSLHSDRPGNSCEGL